MFRPSILSCLTSDNKRICEILCFLIGVTEVSFLLGCDAMSQSCGGERGTLRHILEERRPQHKQSSQILKFVVTKYSKIFYSGVSPEHPPTALHPWSEQPTLPLIRNSSTITDVYCKNSWAPPTFDIHVAETNYAEYESGVHNSLFHATPDSTGSDDCRR